MSQKIEQLWAIQSTEDGAQPVICAASPGLLRDEAIQQHLQPYLSYRLPPEWDMHEHRRKAPISLSLRNIGNSEQRILIHKVYIEQATKTRAGTYFTHVLTNLPNTFSALEAIQLWRSDFWTNTIKVCLDKKEYWNTGQIIDPLETITDATLRLARQPADFSKSNRQKIDRHLSYVIQAHLLQQQMFVESQKVKPLYITAENDEVAYLISTLLLAMPPQLQKDVTFSTYEYDALPASPYWLLGTYLPTNDGVCINYKNGGITPLNSVKNIYAYYSQYFTRCHVNEGKHMAEFHTFFDRFKIMQTISFNYFLDEYYIFHNNSDRAKERLAQFLKWQPMLLMTHLRDVENVRANLIDCALIERGEFLATLIQRLKEIQSQYASQGKPHKGLILLMNDVRDALMQAAETNNVASFLAALALLECLSADSRMWIPLLHKLITETQIIYSDASVRTRLLQIVDNVFSDSEKQEYGKLLSRLQANTKLEEFPSPLTLNTSLDWILPGTENSVLSPQQRANLEQLLSKYGGSLIRRDDYVHTILASLACVIYNGTNPLPIIFSWLDQPLDQPVNKDTLDAIFRCARLSFEHCQIFFKHYRIGGSQPAYISLYPDAVMWRTMLRLFATERKKVDKTNLLSLCLNGLKGHQDLPVDQVTEQLFEAAALSEEEIGMFFENYEHTSALYKSSSTVHKLALEYIQGLDVARLQRRQTLLTLQMISEFLPTPEFQRQVIALKNISIFLSNPTVDITSISTLGMAIDCLSQAWRESLVVPVARILIGCIDDVFQLSSTIATLEDVCRDKYSRHLLQKMVIEFKELFKSNIHIIGHENLQRQRIDLSIYLHYLLIFETLYENSHDFIAKLLNDLLYGLDAETFQFLNTVADFWPPALQEQWRVVEQRLNPSRQPVPPIPVQQQPTEEEIYRQFVPVDQRNVYISEHNSAMGSMETAQREEGARPLALVWLQYSITFMQHRHAIDAQKWLKMKVLSEFFMACQQADTFYPPDTVAEQAILTIANDPERQTYLGDLTQKEKERIALARQRTYHRQQYLNALSGHPDTSALPASISGSQNQNSQWTKPQPQKKRFWQR